MPDKAVISHRGEKYEIGRGKRFYGIWAVGAPYDAPVDRWPENHDGWQQAWARFAVIEVPGTIAPVPRERKALPGGVKLPGPLRAAIPASATTSIPASPSTSSTMARRRADERAISRARIASTLPSRPTATLTRGEPLSRMRIAPSIGWSISSGSSRSPMLSLSFKENVA